VPEGLAEAYAEATKGQAERAKGRLEALERTGLDSHCGDVQVVFLMGQTYYHVKDWVAAERWFRRVLDLDSGPMVYFQMGQICTMTNRPSEAAEFNRKAYEADPANPYIAREYATDLMRQGETQEGMRIMRTAVDLAPDSPQFHSHYLMRLSYLSDLDPQGILDEHLRWAQRHAPAHLARRDHPNVPDPGRRLRIGYLCSEFRNHATVYNFEPFLDGRDRDGFEIFGYGSVGFADPVTERLKSKFDGYRDIRTIDDKAAAEKIAEDQIDILVVIGGHVPDNRLCVLAYRPAPIQVEFGEVATTGMAQIDYRFTDRLRDSPESERWYVERPVYLPGFDCYQPPANAPSVGPLPALRKEFVTFACFNNSLKITTAMLGLWAQILAASKTSRLLLKFKSGEDESIRKAFHDRLGVMSVDPSRVEILGWKPAVDHLALYNEADIGLDTYPFDGCITTLEALWMGVPVVSRMADGSSGYWTGRMGFSHLTRVGLECLAAMTDRQYVVKAVALAQNLPALAKIRGSMRARMTAPGGLCDAKAYMLGVEQAYRRMWQPWCDTKIKDQRSKIKDQK
jgi:predicted O-linked N-acetylglucosamine transferase (SPINDLY family)